MKAAPADSRISMETALSGGEPGTNSTAFIEGIRRAFSAPPKGLPEPQYAEVDRAEFPEAKPGETTLVTPPGMTPRQAWDARRAYVEAQAAPMDSRPASAKARKELHQIQPHQLAGEGVPASKLGGTQYKEQGMGFARHSELEGDEPVRTRVQTRSLDDPNIREDFATFLAARYPKGSSGSQTAKAAADFLRGEDESTRTVQPVSPKLLREFLQKVQPSKKITDKEIRRTDEIYL